MKLQKLILVRHGEYNSIHLTDSGVLQILDLSTKIKELVNGSSVRLFSSQAPRAIESAELITRSVGSLDVEGSGLLLTPPLILPTILDFVRSHEEECEVLILVTHLELVKYFPAYYGKEVLQTELPMKTMPKGSAVFIDCEGKKLEYLYPS